MIKKFCDRCGKEIVGFERTYYLKVSDVRAENPDYEQGLCKLCWQTVRGILNI